jgi:hypothetical protein
MLMDQVGRNLVQLELWYAYEIGNPAVPAAFALDDLVNDPRSGGAADEQLQSRNTGALGIPEIFQRV